MNSNTLSLEETSGSVLSGILLIAGTCIGAGMLGLPVVTGVAGFFPAMVVNTLCWLFMLSTGLLLMEATLWMKEGANILSMAQRFLGPMGKIIGGVFFLFLYYCLLVAYLDGGAPILTAFVNNSLGISLSASTGYFLFAGIFGFAIFLGTQAVDRINWILMIGLITSFVLLVGVGSTEVQLNLLTRESWKPSLFAVPLLFSAYGFHNVIPTTVFYLKRDKQKLRLAIILGTSIPFVVYSIWQWMTIGSLSAEAFHHATENGVPVTQALQAVTGHPLVGFLGGFFGFFALVTSFLGVSLSMVDFLGDGLKMERIGFKRLMLCLAVLLPPTLFVIANSGVFLIALGYAGGFGEAVLNGLFPIAMVWVGRYQMKLGSNEEIPGGRLMLVFLFMIAFSIIAVEIFSITLG